MAKRYNLNQSDRDKLAEKLATEDARKKKVAVRQQTPRHHHGGIPFKNTSGEEIPAYGVMQCSEATLDRNRPYVEVVKPTASGKVFLLNGPRDIPIDGYGIGYREGRALIDGGSTTSDLWSPVASEWELSPNGYHFVLVGTLDAETSFFLLTGNRIMQGVTNAAHAKGATGTIRIYVGGVDSGRTVEAVNDYADLETEKKCHLALSADGVWYLIAGEC